MRRYFTTRRPLRRGPRFLLPLLACILLAGCPWMMEASPAYDLTFRGQVTRFDNGAAVPGARVEVWVVYPERTTTEPFVQGHTDAAGGFVLRDDLREFGAPQAVTVRVTPPAGSGLQAATFDGRITDIFPTITRSDVKYTYTGSFVLQAAAGS